MEVMDVIANLLNKIKVNQVLRQARVAEMDDALIGYAIADEQVKDGLAMKNAAAGDITAARIAVAECNAQEKQYLADLEVLQNLVSPPPEEPPPEEPPPEEPEA